MNMMKVMEINYIAARSLCIMISGLIMNIIIDSIIRILLLNIHEIKKSQEISILNVFHLLCLT